MDEYTLKDGEPIPQKKPKKKMSGGVKALIISLSILIGLPALVIGVAAACFYDPTHKEVEIDENATTESMFKAVLIDSLDDTPTSKKMDLKLTEKDLNTLLHLSFGETLANGKFIKNFYVEANSGTYDFKFEIDAYVVLKTTVALRAQLSIVEDGDVDVLQFDLLDAKVGRIGGFLKFKDLIFKYVPKADIENLFAGTGLNMKLDLDNLRITYRSTDFYDDLMNKIGSSLGGDTSDFVQIFSEIMAQRTLRKMYYEDKTVFGIQMPIDNLKLTPATHEVENLDIEDSVFVTDGINNTVAASIKTLLDQKKITEEANLTVIGSYLAGGYDFLDSSEKAVIDTLGASVFGDGYKSRTPLYDYNIPEEKTIKYTVDEQTRAQVIAHYQWIRTTIPTTFIDNMLRYSKTMGSGSFFTRNTGTEAAPNYKVNYVVLDNLTTIIKDDSIYIALNVDFNGYTGQMTLKCTKLAPESTDPFGTMKLRIDAMYMGDLRVSKKTQDAFVSTITGSLDTQLFKVQDGVIKFDIAAVMEGDGVPELLYDMNFEFVSNTATEDGAIVINADFKGL